uniref:Uncharacterized protein n=1 Tax=Vitis vinifera TaxID=29760 RepID=A5BZ12_VITVI|nr:hypothetical protein VITISV_030715 [Vitis vinifera]
MTVQFLGPHLYQSVIFHISLSRNRTYIDRSSSYSLSRGRTYIDRPSPCHDSSVSGTAPISIGHFPCQFESGPHLYRSVIRHVGLSRGRTYIDRPSSYQFSLSWDCTYIDRSLSCQLESGAAPISIGHLIFMLVQFLGPHLYRSVIIVRIYPKAKQTFEKKEDQKRNVEKMGSLGEILTHPGDIYLLLKLKMADCHVKKQLPPEPRWVFCYTLLHKASRDFSLVVQQLNTRFYNAIYIYIYFIWSFKHPTLLRMIRVFPTKVKAPILIAFYRHICDCGWHFACGVN